MKRWIVIAVLLYGAAAPSPPLFAADRGGEGAAAPLSKKQPAIVILPFDNFSRSNDAPREMTALFAKAVVKRGWRVIASDEVEPLLEKDRVRYLDSLDEQARADIIAATGAIA